MDTIQYGISALSACRRIGRQFSQSAVLRIVSGCQEFHKKFFHAIGIFRKCRDNATGQSAKTGNGTTGKMPPDNATFPFPAERALYSRKRQLPDRSACPSSFTGEPTAFSFAVVSGQILPRYCIGSDKAISAAQHFQECKRLANRPAIIRRQTDASGFRTTQEGTRLL